MDDGETSGADNEPEVRSRRVPGADARRDGTSGDIRRVRTYFRGAREIGQEICRKRPATVGTVSEDTDTGLSVVRGCGGKAGVRRGAPFVAVPTETRSLDLLWGLSPHFA